MLIFLILYPSLENSTTYINIVLHGEDDSSVNLLLNRQEAFFEPGRTYHFITTTNNLGKAMKSSGILSYLKETCITLFATRGPDSAQHIGVVANKVPMVTYIASISK